MEDCFERIICFETLNDAANKGNDPVDGDDREVFDIDEYTTCPDADADLVLPKTPVVCKPFEEAFEQVFKIANISPRKTVRKLNLHYKHRNSSVLHFYIVCMLNQCLD